MISHQHHLWSETHAWLQNSYREQADFHSELLRRACLLCEAGGGGMALENDGKIEWVGRSLELHDVRKWETALGTTLLNPKSPIASTFQTETDDTQRPLIAMAINREGRDPESLILYRENGQPEFGREAELDLYRLIQEAMSAVEKNTLMRELAQSNEALKARQEEQEDLIRQLKQARDQLMQSEKMASIGQLAAGVAHEINNPIGYVRSNLTSLKEYSQSLLTLNDAFAKALGDRFNEPELSRLCEEHDLEFIREDLPSLLDESSDGIERVEKIIRSLRDFSRTDSGEMEELDIHQCLNKTLAVARNEIKYRATVKCDYGELPRISAVDSQLGQVFLNLFVNAAQAIEDQGEITVTTRQTDNGCVEIRISDTGSGIPPENINRLFDPFFTTKPVGKGTGLGLSLSYGIIQRHQGTMAVESEPGRGTTFILSLPVTQPEEDIAV